MIEAKLNAHALNLEMNLVWFPATIKSEHSENL